MSSTKSLVRDLVDKIYQSDHNICVHLADLQNLVTKVLGNGPELTKLKTIESAIKRADRKAHKEAVAWDEWRDSLVR